MSKPETMPAPAMACGRGQTGQRRRLVQGPPLAKEGQDPDTRTITLPFPRPILFPYHARGIVRSHSPLKAMGTVDNDQALFRCHPQLLQQVWLGGPIPRAEGLHDHTLQWGLQEGPDLCR